MIRQNCVVIGALHRIAAALMSAAGCLIALYLAISELLNRSYFDATLLLFALSFLNIIAYLSLASIPALFAASNAVQDDMEKRQKPVE